VHHLHLPTADHFQGTSAPSRRMAAPVLRPAHRSVLLTDHRRPTLHCPPPRSRGPQATGLGGVFAALDHLATLR
jgi:hypothetical protein